NVAAAGRGGEVHEGGDAAGRATHDRAQEPHEIARGPRELAAAELQQLVGAGGELRRERDPGECGSLGALARDERIEHVATERDETETRAADDQPGSRAIVHSK